VGKKATRALGTSFRWAAFFDDEGLGMALIWCFSRYTYVATYTVGAMSIYKYQPISSSGGDMGISIDTVYPFL
jgi:hypothetical protein